MKFFIVIATMLPLLASAQSNTKQQQFHEKEQSEVLKTVKEWNNAFSANNPTLISSLYTMR